jgi:hypothetical protein
MKTLPKIAIVSLVSLIGFNASAAMSTYMETALVDSCKAALSNKNLRLSNTLKGYRLKEKTVAMKVVCNGDDIITFAEKHGADKTAARLSKSLGTASIEDIAAAREDVWSVQVAIK